MSTLGLDEPSPDDRRFELQSGEDIWNQAKESARTEQAMLRIEKIFRDGEIGGEELAGYREWLPEEDVRNAIQRGVSSPDYHLKSMEQSEHNYWIDRYSDEPAEDVDADYHWSQTAVASWHYHQGKSFKELSQHYFAEFHRINEETDGEAYGNAMDAWKMGERFSALHSIQEGYQTGDTKKVEVILREKHVPLEDVEEAKRRGLEASQQVIALKNRSFGG